MLWFYRFLKGFLRIEINGDFPERLINKCANSGINLWNIKYSKEKIYFSVLLGDFYKLFKIKKGYKISVKIKKRNGFPFFVARYRFRYGIFLGFILFCVILYFLNGFIWNIEVKGNNNVRTSEILNLCNEMGIKIGASKGKINTKICSEKLLISNENLAWSAFNIEGCVLTVDVTEVKNKKDDKASLPTNIRAACDGKIEKISVTSGNCVVSVGENVVKGQLLVSGIIEGMHSTEYVHSTGEIIATTNKTYTYTLNYIQEKNQYGDKIKNRKVLSIFAINIPLYLGKMGDNYVSGDLRSKTVFKNVPIIIYERDFTPYKKTKKKYKDDYLKRQAEQMLRLKIESNGIYDYKVEKTSVEKTNKGIKVEFLVKMQENIAYQDILLYNNKVRK